MGAKKSVVTRAVFTKMEKALNDKYADREEEIKGLMLGLVACANVCILGPPGTGKSEMVHDLSKLCGLKYFYLNMSNGKSEDNLLGALDFEEMFKGKRKRLPGYMPDANLSFLDEAFKADGGLHDALLALTSPARVYSEGPYMYEAPLYMTVVASNEPAPEGSEAFWDRFVLRFMVSKARSRADKRKIFNARNIKIVQKSAPVCDFPAVHKTVEAVTLSADMIERMFDLLEAAEREGFEQSNRSESDLQPLLKASAWLDGRTEVETRDLLVAQHTLWNVPKPEEIRKVHRFVQAHVFPALHDINECVDDAREEFDAFNAASFENGDKLVTGAVRTRDKIQLGVNTLEALKVTYPGSAVDVDAALVKVKQWHRQTVAKLTAAVQGI